MSNLYELTAQMLQLQDMLQDDSIDPQIIKDTFEGLQGEYEDNIESLAKIVRNLEAQRDAKKTEAKRLTDSADSIDSSIDRLKNMMYESLKATGNKKIQGKVFTVSYQRNGGKAPVIYDKNDKTITDSLPDSLVVVTEKPNLDAIRLTLEAGNAVKGFALGERGESLRIK